MTSFVRRIGNAVGAVRPKCPLTRRVRLGGICVLRCGKSTVFLASGDRVLWDSRGRCPVWGVIPGRIVIERGTNQINHDSRCGRQRLKGEGL